MLKIIIMGAGGCGREAMLWAEDQYGDREDLAIAGYIDDNLQALANLKSSYQVLGTIRDWQPEPDQRFVCAIAKPAIRKAIVTDYKQRGATFISVIHPSALIASTSVIGEGAIISPHALVSDNTIIGDFVILNLHTIIAHDARVGSYCTLSSFCDVTGNVKLGDEVFLGSHASIVPGIVVQDGAFICAGSTVMTNVKANTKVLGTPARKFAL